ncbi:hypothetical protein [Actinoplanes sp. NPDC049265]|uniref:hypothetical protein n=1 Tax=Actinoplanes sp. NPDC049265 TaxID=3363902 RepID=UPI0037176AAB
MFAALAGPDRPWLRLLADEQPPDVAESAAPGLIVWSSPWSRRPDARIRFDLRADGPDTRLRWTLLVDEPMPGQSLLGHLRKRLNEMINADLRYSFGQ